MEVVKSLKQDCGGIGALRDQGQLISDSKSKADLLNNYFRSVFTTEQTHNILNKGISLFPVMRNFKVTKDGVLKLLNDLNPAKAAGPDGLPSRVLKLQAHQIAPVLTEIYNCSLQSGELPQDWKKAIYYYPNL